MGTTVNTSGNGGYALYTGVATMSVVAVNPDLAELKELGFNYEDEPKYEIEDEGVVSGTILTFYLQAEWAGKTITAPLTYWFRNESINSIWLDTFGRFSSDQATLEGECWHPYKGEIDLILFLESLCNVGKEDENYLDNKEKILEGDVSELKELLIAAEDNKVKALLGVRKRKYQTVYARRVERSWTKTLKYLWKDIVKNHKHIKEDYGAIDRVEYNENDFKLMAYETPPEEESEEDEVDTRNSTDTVADDVADAVSGEEKLDLPF